MQIKCANICQNMDSICIKMQNMLKTCMNMQQKFAQYIEICKNHNLKNVHMQIYAKIWTRYAKICNKNLNMQKYAVQYAK